MRFLESRWTWALTASLVLSSAGELRGQQSPFPLPKFAPPQSPTPLPARILRPVASETPPELKKVAEQPAQADDFNFGLSQHDLFRVESEEAFQERIRQEMAKVKNGVFPKDVPMVSESNPFRESRNLSAGPVLAPICYRPLYFEDKRTERFGHYYPCVQPLVSLARFGVDVGMLPYRHVN